MRSSGRAAVTNIESEDIVVPIDWQLISQLLQKQTPRWCHVTTTLWSIIASDTQRTLDQNSLSQFFEVIYWRAHGKISAEEFSVLFTEWMKPATLPIPAGNIKKKNNNAISVMLLRNLVFEKKYSEADLDLFIGIVVHETNTRLLNATISYTNKSNISPLQTSPINANAPKVTFTALPSYNLEVVTTKWLELSEELFFLFDTPGYGSLNYDEIYFFINGILVGLQNWKNYLELENTLQLIHTSSMTIQSMKEFGVNIQPFLTPGRASLPNITSPNRSTNGNLRKSTSGHQNFQQKFEISLTMFKKYLLKKHLGENELLYLIQYFQEAIERINKLAKLSNAEELYFSSSPVENLGNVIGSPRLWQHAVLLASGYFSTVQNSTSGFKASPILPSKFPPIVLFLLSDGDLHVSVLFRAIEFPIEGISFGQDGFSVSSDNNLLQHGVHCLVDYNNPLLSTIAANEELHDNALRLFLQFLKWGQDPANVYGAPSSSNVDGLSEYQRDPIYQLILSSLLQYKRLQHFLSAAQFDFAVSQFGMSPQTLSTNDDNHQATYHTATNQYNHSLALLCHGLVPNNQEILSEFGLIDNLLVSGVEDTMTTTTACGSIGSSANGVMGMHRYHPKVQPTTTNTTVSSTAKRMLLDELDQELLYNQVDEDMLQTFSASSSRRSDDENEFLRKKEIEIESKERTVKLESSNGKIGVSSANSISSAISSATHQTSSTTAGSLKISSIPVAEKRKSDLLLLNKKNPFNSTESNDINRKESKLIRESNEKRIGNGTPNYIKPTVTSSAKFASGKYTNEVELAEQTKYAFPPPLPPSVTTINISAPKPNKVDKVSKEFKSTPETILPNGTTISPVPYTGSSVIANPDAQFSSDSEYSQLDQIQWKSLLDTPFTALTSPGSNGSMYNTLPGASNNFPPESSHQIEYFSPVKLTNDESRLLAQLLISTNPLEQQRIIGALKTKMNNFSILSPTWDFATRQNQTVVATVESRKEDVSSSLLVPQYDLFDPSMSSCNTTPASIVPNSLVGDIVGENSSGDNFPNPSEASSSNLSAPSSILELLQQGHNPGKYAQMLREILRKMSKDDANVRLRSLEQVLLLGQNIVMQDSDEKRKKFVSPVSSPANNNATASPNRQVVTLSPTNNSNTANRSRGGNTNPAPQQRSHSNPMSARRSPTNDGSTSSNRNSPSYLTTDDFERKPKVISRAIKAPGLMPDIVERKPKKAFGHPLN